MSGVQLFYNGTYIMKYRRIDSEIIVKSWVNNYIMINVRLYTAYIHMFIFVSLSTIYYYKLYANAH